MKLCDAIQVELSTQFETVLVKDERGDGHFVQVVCVDTCFTGLNAVARSRQLYQAVEPWQPKVHAWSVKGFTPEEWATKAADFKFQDYQHYPKH